MTGCDHYRSSLRRWCLETVVLFVSTGLLGGLLLSCSGESSQPASTNATDSIAGVDADANGVRDDVETYLDTTYTGQANADLNNALRQYAKAVQSSLVDAEDQTLSLSHTAERFRALECLMARRPDEFHTIFVEVRAKILNTPSRSEAYLKADNQAKIANLPLLPADQWATACQS